MAKSPCPAVRPSSWTRPCSSSCRTQRFDRPTRKSGGVSAPGSMSASSTARPGVKAEDSKPSRAAMFAAAATSSGAGSAGSTIRAPDEVHHAVAVLVLEEDAGGEDVLEPGERAGGRAVRLRPSGGARKERQEKDQRCCGSSGGRLDEHAPLPCLHTLWCHPPRDRAAFARVARRTRAALLLHVEHRRAEARAPRRRRQGASRARTQSFGARDRGTRARSTVGSISGRDRRPFRLT